MTFLFDEDETRRQHERDLHHLTIVRYWQFGHHVEPEEEEPEDPEEDD